MKHNPVQGFVEKIRLISDVTDIEVAEPVENKNDTRYRGRFNLGDEKFQFISSSGNSYSFLSLEYKIRIDHESSPLDLYQAANHVNNACPGMKCVIDDIIEKHAHLTFSAEVSSKGVIDPEPIVDMIRILPSGFLFLLDKMKSGD